MDSAGMVRTGGRPKGSGRFQVREQAMFDAETAAMLGWLAGALASTRSEVMRRAVRELWRREKAKGG